MSKRAAVASSDRKSRRITKSCPVQLTTDERLAVGDEMARATQDLQRAMDRKQEVSAQLAADLKAHQANVTRLGQLLSNGYEYRDVPCIESMDFASGIATVAREDTGEVVMRRPMRPEELQGELPLTDEGDD